MDDLSGKVAVITGAGGGIGAACARRAATLEMRLALTDVDEEALEAVTAELLERGAEAVPFVVDVRDPDAVEALAADVDEHFGSTHLVINNAGVGSGRGLAWEEPLEDWDWIIDVNLWGAIHVARSFVPRMLLHGEPGHMVITASMAGVIGGPGMAAYRVSKFGVAGLAETLYADLQLVRAPIGVSLLCPGWVRTAINETDRFREVEAATDGLSPEADAMVEFVAQAVDTGIEPDEVARQVFAAVEAGRFYVFTHPEWNKAISYRAQNMLEGANPPPGPLTKAVWER